MNNLDLLTEQEIIDRILNGEKALYEIIVRRYNPYLYKIGRSYNYSHEDTMDLMQDSFVDAYKNLSKFEGRSNFKTWIIRIMLNNSFRKKEKSSFKNEVNQDFNDMSRPLFNSRSENRADTMFLNKELIETIEKALSKIPEEYRLVFTLREMNGMNVAETATLLNISESNVKVRLNRAKIMLRNLLEETYAPEELFEFNLVFCDAIVANVMARIHEL
ncbi:MAG: sigma-70 family RNA polymerase sigma factor [Saprospiraceae bacterium]|nr:MAG: sigma-70 family RNA polymerase sigma factor [Bacteroidetes bacterium OLB9]MCO6463690.1 sigma-70 family RNA polymerase sigma factor [Saprospiraceae bacterium]MCZ2337049.1 sigma-70 family RNA polymerase sigma factor [Chitinophagales bacterium]